MSGKYYEDTELCGNDFSKNLFTFLRLVNMKLLNLRLIGSAISSWVVVDSTFNNCDFRGAEFIECLFVKTTFIDCSFRGADLQNCSFYDCTFEGCKTDGWLKGESLFYNA